MARKKIEIDEGLLGQVVDWQHEQGLRSRGAALEALVEKGLQLAAAESLGFRLEDDTAFRAAVLRGVRGDPVH